jgi:cobalt/nickel transport system ATP-binding protein
VILASNIPIYQLRGVSYNYLGRQPALHKVTMIVRRGETVVILGANGCGKSTLLKIMDGLICPTSGSIQAFGEDLGGIVDDTRRSQQLHRRVGLVFQDADVQLFSPTVWDDIAFGPLQMGWEAKEVIRHTRQALELMGVGHLADRAPYELSGGEKKRVAIASVLSTDPEVLLLDEPTANLDPRSKAVLLDLIRGVGKSGKTVVATTQELEIVPHIASRVVVFGQAERRPVAEGSPDDILDDTGLLIRANLIHEHLHTHGSARHAHPHDPAHHE